MDGLVSDPIALFDLGCTLFENGHTEAAIEAYRRSLLRAPGNAGTCYNLGNALLTAGRPVEAVDSLVACLRSAPGFGAAYVNLSEALRRVGLLDDAHWAAGQGVLQLPGLAEAKIALANVLHDKAEYKAAAAIYREVLTGAPDHAGVLNNLGATLQAMGHLGEALAAHERAVALAPHVADFHFGLATTLLAAGIYDRGWAEYEWRWQRSQAGTHRPSGTAWRGEDIADSTILLHAEQGLGDTLQFVRYAPLVASRGARVLLEVQPSLARLLRGTAGVAELVVRGDLRPHFDWHCPLLSLPLAFGSVLETIPATLPYLHADPSAVTAWGKLVPSDGRLRVGLVWAGSPHNDDIGAQLIDRRRSIPPAALAPLACVPGIRLVSLQKDPAGDPPEGIAFPDAMAGVVDFADTAALVANLDLVIAVDTSVAHLAAGLGRPVWLLSRFDGCWRWLHGRDDSPWYPGMRIYHQDRPHDWSGVIARVCRDLVALTRHRPGSAGDAPALLP